MPLKTLSFNQGVLRQNIRSLSWIGIIYFLVLLFILPLQFILTYENENPISISSAKFICNDGSNSSVYHVYCSCFISNGIISLFA